MAGHGRAGQGKGGHLREDVANGVLGGDVAVERIQLVGEHGVVVRAVLTMCRVKNGVGQQCHEHHRRAFSAHGARGTR